MRSTRQGFIPALDEEPAFRKLPRKWSSARIGDNSFRDPTMTKDEERRRAERRETPRTGCARSEALETSAVCCAGATPSRWFRQVGRVAGLLNSQYEFSHRTFGNSSHTSSSYFFPIKTSAGRWKRALSFRTCAKVSFRCPDRNMETALSEPN